MYILVVDVQVILEIRRALSINTDYRGGVLSVDSENSHASATRRPAKGSVAHWVVRTNVNGAVL